MIINRRSLDDHDRWDRANNDDNSRSSNVEQGRVSDIARRQSLSVEEEECECARGSDVHGRLDEQMVMCARRTLETCMAYENSIAWSAGIAVEQMS